MGDEDDAWNDNLPNQPFYDPGRAFPTFNQLFTALWDLILIHITKMGIFAPEVCGCSLKNVFNTKIPAFASNDDDDAATAEISGKLHLISPEIIAYLNG